MLQGQLMVNILKSRLKKIEVLFHNQKVLLICSYLQFVTLFTATSLPKYGSNNVCSVRSNFNAWYVMEQNILRIQEPDVIENSQDETAL